jgi:NitT/TauT family transport system substrate-binding protein
MTETNVAHVITRRRLLVLGGAAAAGGILAACAPAAAPSPAATTAATAAPTVAAATPSPTPKGRLATRTTVTHAVNFFAQTSQGGFWAAAKDKEYDKLNLEVTMKQGSPQISPVTMVASGQQDFNQQTMDTILLSRAQGIPLVALMAPFSDTPLGVMYYNANPLKDFADLKGRTAYLGFTSNWYKYIVKKFDLDGKFEVRNYTGTIQPFLADSTKKFVTQCFISSEPIVAKKQGFDVGYLRVADSGYNPYTNMLFTSEQVIKDKPDVVQAVVTAGLKGWLSFIAKPADYIPYLKEQNPDYDVDLAAEGQKVEATLYTGKTFDKAKFGLITMDRVKTIHDQMREVGVLDKDLDVSKSFAPQFLEKAFTQI